MDIKYTVNQLEEMINLSHTKIRERIKQGRLRSVEEMINNRKTTVVLFTAEEFQALVNEKGLRKVEATENKSIVNLEKTFNKQPEINNSNTELAFKVVELSQLFTKELKEYNDRLINSESKRLLLEDKSKDTEFYKGECSRFQRENDKLLITIENITKENEAKTALLQSQIDLLQAENQQLKQKSFFGLKFGK